MDRPAFGSKPDPASPLAPAPPEGCVRLRILATSDIHMHLLPWDYYIDRPSRLRGLSLLAGLIAQARAEVEHSLLVDNGDFLQGSPIGDLIAETAAMRKAEVHPMIAAMNHLGYVAACLGNHEFSHGLEFLQGALAGARFAPLSANILTARGPSPAEDLTLCQPSLMVERMIAIPGQAARPLRIGLVGLTPPQVVNWENHVLKGRLSVRGMHDAAAHHLAELRAKGADLVVALAHSGLGDETTPRDHENSVIRLAKELEFDALVAGHIHTTFLGPDFAPTPHLDPARGMVFGKPVVMPGFNGSHLGLIDLDLRPGATGGWTVVGRQAMLRAVYRRSPGGRVRATVKQDETIRQIALPAHASTRRWARRRIGHIDAPLHSYFALARPSAAVTLVAQAQAEHLRRALRGTDWGGLPVLSAAAPFRSGGRSGPGNYTFVPSGPISLRNIADLYSFPNTPVGFLLTGAEVVEWLERAAAQFCTITPGARDAELINAAMPGFDFDMIHGLTYRFDLSGPARYDVTGRLTDPAAHRLREVRHAGAPIDPAARFVLASNSYRLGGGGGYPGARDSRAILRGGEAIRSILASHIAAVGRLAPEGAGEPPWGFVPMPGTSVTFLSAAEAEAHIAPQDQGRLKPLDLTEAGFRRFRLDLG